MINISPIYATTIVQKLALYCSSYNGNDVYYLKEVVLLMINLFGEEKLIDMLKKDNSPNKDVLNRIGKEWNKPFGMKKKLVKISMILEKINKSYSILDDKTIPKSERDKIKYKEFINQCNNFPKIENDFYALFIFLIDNSSIRNMNISNQYFKVLESGGKTFGGINKERIGDKKN
jgi:hypothetical protein